jgi:hypothetical protein
MRSIPQRRFDVAEELRFFLRTALYTIVITTVYWFLSYEIAGSVMLLVLGLAAIFFVATTAFLIRHLYRSTDETRASKRGVRRAGVVSRTIGFDEPSSDSAVSPVAVEEGPIATSSPWPIVLALALALIGAGLLFGGWTWIPGGVMALVAGWGWITELET